jgi:hypothetical protein
MRVGVNGDSVLESRGYIMSKYFELDKDQGSESKNSQKFAVYLTVAILIIALISAFRFINNTGTKYSTYGIDRLAKEFESYKVTGKNKTKKYDTYSLAGHCIRALRRDGITEMGKITYIGYDGSVMMSKSEWGLHKFNVTDLGGTKGNNSVVIVAFKGGWRKPNHSFYNAKVYKKP